MRILLVSPPFYRILGFYNRYFPIGVTIIGTALKNAGHEVAIYDADANDQPRNIDYSQLPSKYPDYLSSLKDPNHPIWLEMRNTIQEFRPDLIGIAAYTTFAAAAFHTARIAKEVFPDCPIVLGGPHANIQADEALRICPQIDYAIRGEGEDSVIELVRSLSDGGTPELKSIRGLSYRADRQIIHNASRERIKNQDLFPFPDRSLLMNVKKYTSEDMGLIMTSRGCPYSCTYCATDTKKISYRGIKGVLEEVAYVKKNYGTTQFTFKDDSFTVSKRRVKEFCDALLSADMKIRWECNTRVDLLDKDLISKMKLAGCNFIKVGIESGSERILKSMCKGITLEQIRDVGRLLNRSGLHWTGYFLMGVPGETVEDIHATLAIMNEIKPDLALIGVYEPFPGTPMFEDGVNKGLTKREMTLDDFFTTLPNDYYKLDPMRQTDTISPEEFETIECVMKRSFHRYNKRPQHILKMAWAKSSVYMRDPRLLWDDFKKFLGYMSTRGEDPHSNIRPERE